MERCRSLKNASDSDSGHGESFLVVYLPVPLAYLRVLSYWSLSTAMGAAPASNPKDWAVPVGTMCELETLRRPASAFRSPSTWPSKTESCPTLPWRSNPWVWNEGDIDSLWGVELVELRYDCLFDRSVVSPVLMEFKEVSAVLAVLPLSSVLTFRCVSLILEFEGPDELVCFL